MNKQTKTLVMVGVVGVGAYLILKQMKPKASFSGGVKSKRMRGLTGVADNMNVKNSQWVRPALNGQKLSLTGVNENANVMASPFSWK
jgi:hypothetical protein